MLPSRSENDTATNVDKYTASRFLEDIDQSYIMVNKKYSTSEPVSPSNAYFARNFVKSNKKKSPKKFTAPPKHVPSPDFAPSDTSQLAEGMKVEHPKFGFGVVKMMDEEGANRKAKVEFDGVGEKTLLLSFAKLRILENES